MGAIAIVLTALVIFALVSRRLFIRFLLRPVLTVLYRKELHGLENLPKDRGCVIISNHVSWIDGILILWMMPRNVRFVVDGGNFDGAIARWIAGAFDTILMTASPKSIGRALKTARQGLIDGDVVGIFPEGTLTRTGQLQAFKPGIKKILKGTDAVVVPLWVEGMWGSIFSFSGGKFFFKWPKHFRRKLIGFVGEPMPGDTPTELMRSKLQDLGAKATIENRKEFPVLAGRAIRVWKKASRRLQAADSTGVELSGRELLIRTLALRRTLRREVLAHDEQFVGILLPPSVGGVSVNVALAMDQRVSANLNYTVSSSVLNHCISEIGIKHVLSSERFLSKLDLQLDAEVVLLDEIKEKVTKADKAIAFVQSYLPSGLLDRILGLHKVQSDDLLTVIFTSGSTGMPKGVLLSNANISHNVDAIDRAIKLTTEDTVLGILPFFHSFGYSV
ncbi:MAG: AMP-binding protein, partial [Pirellulaceae bacterium]|nr:AMP-binding protein [Pirellulaceae bacterium]